MGYFSFDCLLSASYFFLSLLGCLASSSKFLSHTHYSGETCAALFWVVSINRLALHCISLGGMGQPPLELPREGKSVLAEEDMLHVSHSTSQKVLRLPHYVQLRVRDLQRANVLGFHRCPLECHCHSVRQVVFFLSDAVIVFFPPSFGGAPPNSQITTHMKTFPYLWMPSHSWACF